MQKSGFKQKNGFLAITFEPKMPDDLSKALKTHITQFPLKT